MRRVKRRLDPFVFFITPPHGKYDIPKDDPAWDLYRGVNRIKGPSQAAKNYAAMVSMVDRNLGEVLDLLKELGIEDNTIVFFSGDNGGQDRFPSKKYPRGIFSPNVNPKTGVEFRGGKGNLYEGGLRIPFLVRWPGKIMAGQVSDLLFYQPDVLPTLAELTGATAPQEIDGLSILPTLLGEEAVGHEQQQHEFLYWEFGTQTAVRMNHWKAIKINSRGPWELYDLNKDISEKHNIAAEHPGVLAKMKALAAASHEPVRPGTYTDRTAQNKDHAGRWGASNRANESSRKVNSLPQKDSIPNKLWALTSFSSENKDNQRLARFAIDGDPHTFWHSQFTQTLAEMPHELVIDLGDHYIIQAIRYLARQDTS